MNLLRRNQEDRMTVSAILFDAFSLSSGLSSARAARASRRNAICARRGSEIAAGEVAVGIEVSCWISQGEKTPPTGAVTDRRSRTGATGGVSRGTNRLSTEVVLLKWCRQCTTPRYKFRVERYPGQYRTLQETPES